jgi:hypothetical protein
LQLRGEVAEPLENALAPLLERARLAVEALVAAMRLALDLLRHRFRVFANRAGLILGRLHQRTRFLLGLAASLRAVGIDSLPDVARVVIRFRAQPLRLARQLLDPRLGVGLGALARLRRLAQRIGANLLGRLLRGLQDVRDAGAYARRSMRGRIVRRLRVELRHRVLGTAHPSLLRSLRKGATYSIPRVLLQLSDGITAELLRGASSSDRRGRGDRRAQE